MAYAKAFIALKIISEINYTQAHIFKHTQTHINIDACGFKVVN